MRRFFFGLTLICLSVFTAIGQQSKAEYINMEMQILQQRLSRCEMACILSNTQLESLLAVYADKADRVMEARKANGSKDNLSSALRSIDKEFTPKIAAILTVQQRKYAESLHQAAF